MESSDKVDEGQSRMKIINVKRKDKMYGTEFHCRTSDFGPTDDVNKLSPFNVGVVAALGDSITAAFGEGSKSLMTLFYEYKGESWSIGGKGNLSSVTTLPNILKLFNQNLLGFSKHRGSFKSTEAFNVATSSSTVRDLLGQAKDLVRKMNAKGRTVLEEWKVITIFIGSNDLCAEETCKNEIQETVKEYMKHLHKAMKYLHDNVKKAFINLSLLLDVSILAPLTGLECDFVHSQVCSCAMEVQPDKASQVCKAINNAIIKEFQEEHPYDKKEFAVVVQPLYDNTTAPYRKNKADMSYLAPDCFHFSQKSHTLAATQLWNNMFEPVGRKTAGFQWGKRRKLKCPDSNFPFFLTNANSGQMNS